MQLASRRAAFPLFLAFGLLVTACGSDKPKPETAAKANAAEALDSNTTVANDARNAKGDDPGKAAVNIDPAIQKACGISADAAHFDFDSSRVRADDDRTLQAVAVCFASGPLKGRRLNLVGHADPRGDSEYNVVLGQARADAVMRHVQAKGLGASQTSSTSRGAMDATGTDDAGWARDRRVDLMLGQ
jgi:peptidoglycan-associated lipoprotein